ncbi:hypothetical protein [Chitinophaga sp. LS1]|uniref:hypothetical protein n=1 Tax=Chitinophaga sp. LS1 TaxID=3051176 RepID=UPI002AAB68A0|nr:hypothetical protein [Chitinophaga sp. LS1]WPV66323.1 hypothetical protein QQL36_31490 [Chitinophaga sp. LS1]
MAKVEVRITAKPEKSGIKKAKERLKKRLDNHGITLIKLSEREECNVHYQTVKAAFSTNSFYWNQDVVNLAQDMIEEKKMVLQ